MVGEGPTALRLHVTISLPSVLLPVQAKSSPVRPNASTRSPPDLSDSHRRPPPGPTGPPHLKIVPRPHSAPVAPALPAPPALTEEPAGLHCAAGARSWAP